MNKIKIWLITHHQEITWFLIGWLSMAGLEQLTKQEYANALIDFGLVFLNYHMSRT